MYYTVKVNDEIAVIFEAKPYHKTLGLILADAAKEWAKTKVANSSMKILRPRPKEHD